MRDHARPSSSHRRRRQELHRPLERGFNERKPELFEEVLAPHLVDHNVLIGSVDLRQRVNRVQTAFPGAEYRVGEHMLEGDSAAWR